jgi:hypothetical protein
MVLLLQKLLLSFPPYHLHNTVFLYRLLEAHGKLIKQICQWMQHKFENVSTSSSSKSIKTNANFEKWIDHTAQISTKCCSGFATDFIPRGETKSDSNGWLPLLLAVRTCQTIDKTNESVVAFFAYFACHASRLYMNSIMDNWDEKLEQNMELIRKEINHDGDEDKNWRIELKMKCVVTAEVVLESILKVGDEITRDGPRFLAAVDMAVQCEQMGIALFHFHAQISNKSVGTIYRSIAEAGVMAGHFDRLGSHSIILKTKVLSVLVDKNMMRVKELLSLMCGFYRDLKNKAAVLGNRRDSVGTTQSQLNTFIKSKE